MRLFSALALLLCLAAARAQQRPQAASGPEQPASFKTSVTVVVVPVVVRDKKGRAVGGLQQEDFRLSDNGKPQEIAKFAVERIGGSESETRRQAGARPSAGPATPPPSTMPERFVAYLFDDLHIKFGDMVRVRDAAGRHFRSSLQPGDRAAIYSTSGQTMLEFTADRDRLQETLKKLMPRPMNAQSGFECPDISYYQADLIVNRHDQEALNAAIAEVMVCHQGISREEAVILATQTARHVLEAGELETRVTFSTLRDVIRRMSALPGQRSIILASPGFLAPDLLPQESDIIDRAIRAGVTIGAIDARGLWTDPSLDASKRTISADAIRVKAALAYASASAETNILAEFAAGTGGRFFQNSNDLDDGLRQVAAAPEFVYLLSFSPLNLKMDGKYHNLKVSLKEANGLTAEARKGYFAPKTVADPAQQAKQDMYETIFSRKELNEIPADLRTQFFKRADHTARLAVVVRVPLSGVQFRKVEERNTNDVTIVSTIFDSNGNLVAGKQQHFEMRLKDETLARRAESGFTGRTTFDLKPGSYLVRMAVRDAEGRLTAQNSAVDIPADGDMDNLMASLVVHQMLNADRDRTPAAQAGTVTLQAPYFYLSPDTVRVRVAAAIPAGHAGEVDVVGAAYAPDGKLAARFTNKVKAGPTQIYEDQFDLSAGRYRLELLFSSGGAELGRAEAPLDIEPRDVSQFGLSEIAFSKDYRRIVPEARSDFADGGLRDADGPLITEEYEFPLAASRSFKPADAAALYVVMYDPQAPLENAPEPPMMTVRERVLDRGSGELRWDSGPNDAARYLRTGSTMVAVGLKLPVSLLPAGAYRLELTATDPAGRSATRTADFEIQ